MDPKSKKLNKRMTVVAQADEVIEQLNDRCETLLLTDLLYDLYDCF